MSTSSNHTKAFVQCCHGKHTEASSRTLLSFYVNGSGTDISFVSFLDTGLDIMTPGTVVVWTSIYLATSVIWLVISGLLFLGRLHKKHAKFLLLLF